MLPQVTPANGSPTPGFERFIRSVADRNGRSVSQATVKKLADHYRSAAADYAAAQPSRFRRTRTQLGGTADAHFRTAYGFWEVREYARDYDRNDVYVAQMVNRYLDNVLGTGSVPDPMTGDKDLNAAITSMWTPWASNPRTCDHAGRHDFRTMERLSLRHEVVDGDCFGMLPDTPGIQLLEGDRCTSHHKLDDDVVHGVKVDLDGRVIEYMFLTYKEGDRKRHRLPFPGPTELLKVPALRPDGNPLVLHIFNPERLTQSRGVTAFHACFDRLGQIEDVDFAKLVQQQMVSCISAFITSEYGHELGEQTVEDANNVLESLSPGQVLRLKPGESINGFSPNVPNTEYLPHARHLLRSVGLSVGMPLELVTLDATDSTFHGFRAALDQAEVSFRVRRLAHRAQFNQPVYEWKLRQWFPELVGKIPDLFKCRWSSPRRPYFDPGKDAAADRVICRSGFDSPRNRIAARGGNIEDVTRETIEDNKDAIIMAIEATKEIEEKTEVKVGWREVLRWDMAEGVTTFAGDPEDLAVEDPETVIDPSKQPEPEEEFSRLDADFITALENRLG